MDISILFHTFQNSSLLAILLFGAYLIYMQLPRSSVRNIFLFMLLLWSVIIGFNSYDQIMRHGVGFGAASPLNPGALMMCLISQPILLLLFYNLVFPLRKSLIVIAIHCAIILALAIVVCLVDINSSASYFDTYHSISEAYANIGTPLMMLKLLFVLLQLGFSASALVVAFHLVPIYQRFVEQNESNTTFNTLWIKQVGILIFTVTTAYLLNILFLTYTTATIYYVVVVITFVRMINIFLQNSRLGDYGELYSKINIKWSVKRLWYIEEKTIKRDTAELNKFREMIDWIEREQPYTNPNFTFSDVAAKYDTMSYNEFDLHLKSECDHSFQSYIRECRINDAIRIMSEESPKPLLKDIAYRVGFESNSAFSRAFKAVKGISASEWRETK